MTKIDLRLSDKAKEDYEKDKTSLEPPPTTEVDLSDDPEVVANQKREEERVSIEEILASVGLDTGVDDEPSPPPPPTMDWGFIRRVCTAQIVLSLISLTCITLTVVLGGMLWYKFTATAWTLFLLLTAYTGHCAGNRKCYAHMVAYCIMNAFQTLLHWGSMAWLIYMIYSLDDKSSRGQQVENDPKMDIILFLELGESLALLGTILTGIFGMVACCKGFGRLMAAQDRRIMEEIEEQNIQQQEEANNPVQDETQIDIPYTTTPAESTLDNPC